MVWLNSQTIVPLNCLGPTHKTRHMCSDFLTAPEIMFLPSKHYVLWIRSAFPYI